jgi:hypothetical protein
MKYALMKIFIVVWASSTLLTVYYWSTLNIYAKIIVGLVLAFTAPDSVKDVFLSYKAYKSKWENSQETISLNSENNNKNNK